MRTSTRQERHAVPAIQRYASRARTRRVASLLPSRREREPVSGSVVALKRRLLLMLAVMTCFGYPLTFLWLLRIGSPLAAGSAVICGAILLSALTILLRNGWPTLAGWLLPLGNLAVAASAIMVFQRPALMALFLVTIVASRLLGGVTLAVLTTSVASLLTLFLAHRHHVGDVEVWLLAYASTCLTMLVAGSTLELSDFWEQKLATTQRDTIRQLRERQGDLNRTLKALNEAYDSLKRTSEELAVARRAADQARALKEQFVANVSHELRTPLNLIVGFAEMMYLSPECYEGVRWTPELESDIQELYRASRHLQSLVDDVLDLSRIDASRLPLLRELQDIRIVVAEAVDTLAPLFRQRGLYCRVEQPEDLPRLLIDRTRIRQVLLNLCNNAIRFTDAGGVTIRIASLPDAVQVSVCDTGSGIPRDQLDRIFEQFHQVSGDSRRRGGVGLGLTIARQFVQLHGGRIWAESRVGVGSTFHFTLPLPGAVPHSTPLYATPPPRQQAATQRAVVVVDPDPSVAHMIRRYVGGDIVLEAPDASAAEDLIECQHPLAVIVNQAPDTPAEGWLGPLGQRCRQYSVPVLRCSIPSPSWLRRTTNLDGVLTKPVSRETLERVVRQYCGPSGTVLVVDDYPGFVSMVSRMLAAMGSVGRVLTAYSGQQALALAREARPDLMLLDLLMPEMDGFEVLRRLRADPDLAGIRIVATTATNYVEEALSHLGGALTVSQSQGLPTGTVLEALTAILGIVRPRYA
ncbi:MAG: hybrid sensor histidine kinase/response regulator [Anaerolineae bacterium]|nr:hybrid sensor histidine kinase/response regulator [Anaerolineae bacterium]